MKKNLFAGFCLLLLWSCLKTNSTIPITEVQQTMAGKWQVDSTVTIFNGKVYADTVYINHFVTIANTGGVVHISMQGSDIMNYTIINGSFLQPYTSSSVLNIGSRGTLGCGAPYSLTQFSLSANTFRLITNAGLDWITTTYMHR